MKQNLPFQEIDSLLDKFPQIRLEFYDFISEEIPEYMENQSFLMKKFDVYIENNQEQQLINFIKQNFEKLNKEKAIEELNKTDFFDCLQYYYERLQNKMESFKYCCLIYIKIHIKNFDKQSRQKNLQKLNQLINQEDFIIQKFIISLDQVKDNEHIKELRKLKEQQLFNENSNTDIQTQSMDQCQLQQIINGKKVILKNKDFKKFFEYTQEFQFFMQICDNNSHEQCQKLKGLVLLKILQKSRKENIIFKILDQKFVSKKVLQNILKQLSFTMNYAKKTLALLVINQIDVNIQVFIKGFQIYLSCNVCKRKSITQYDRTNLMILKPYCHHTYHYYCMTQIIKLLKDNRQDIYQNYNEKNQYEECLICENIQQLFRVKKQVDQQQNDILGKGINSVINTIESALDPVQKMGQGLIGVFDNILTFGQIEKNKKIENNENQQQNIQEELQSLDGWLIESTIEEKQQRKNKYQNFITKEPNFVDFDFNQFCHFQNLIMVKIIYLYILLIKSLSCQYKENDILRLYNSQRNQQQIIIDPKNFLSQNSKDLILEQMQNMPFVDNQQILNILIIVDKFENENRGWFQEKDIIEFSENIIQTAVPNIIDRDHSLLSIYAIYDRLYRIRTGKYVREILKDEYTTNIAKHIKDNLKSQRYNNAFEVLYIMMNKCLQGDQESCQIGTGGGWIFCLILIVMGSFILFNVLYTCYQDRKKKNIQQNLRKRFQTLKEIKEKKIDHKIFIQDNCVICLESLNDENRKKKDNDKQREVLLSCGHNFHQNCIEEWNKKQNNCPLCKQNIDGTQEQDPQSMNYVGEIFLNNALFEIQNDLYRDQFTRTQMRDMFERNVWSWNTYTNSRSGGGGGFSYDSSSGGTAGGW